MCVLLIYGLWKTALRSLCPHKLKDCPLTLEAHLGPLGASRLGSGPQARDGVPLLLLGQQVQRHLQPDGLHVVLTERRRHVHVHLQEAA